MTKLGSSNWKIEGELEDYDYRHTKFREELKDLINKYSMEERSNTPDFLLAEYLSRTLGLFDVIVEQREKWYREKDGKKREAHVKK